jgi:molybdopterin biosynthesis enzyme
MGIEPAAAAPLPARLSKDHFNGGNRPTYHPARWEWSQSGAVVEPVKWNGSADLSATVEANAMVLFAEGDRLYRAGEVVEVFVW